MVRHGGIADPGKLLPIELDFLASDELIEVERRLDRSDGETIRFSYAVDVIGRDHGSHAGHVLHDEVGIARNMFGEKLGNEASVEVVHTAGGSSCHKPDSLVPIEGSLGLEVSSPDEHKEQSQNIEQHG